MLPVLAEHYDPPAARVPKSVKGAVSKAAARKSLWVRVPPRALVDRANSPDELLDLVDEHDRVIGTVRHGAADGDPGLIHREVAIVIHRGDELLWQLRSAAKRVLPLTWDFACAGHVGAGDEPASAAHRELLEELGFDTELRVLERRLVREPNETHFAYLFAGSVPEGVERAGWPPGPGAGRFGAEAAAAQKSPTVRPSLSMSISNAAGFLPRPGIWRMSPHSGTSQPAPL